MLKNKTIVGLAIAGALALSAGTAAAQAQEGTQELHIYGGQLFGDDLTDVNVSGRTPELDDDVTYGLRYAYNFTDAWGVEVSLGQSRNSVTRLNGGDIDLDLTTLDVDAVWNIDTGSRLVPYVLAGVGYATADLDRPIVGVVSSRPVSIDDDDGFTANAGIGAKYFATDRFLVRLEARYRYVDAVVDRFDDALSTVETTLGVGWTF
jgi:outer membrane beta-barrel protein